LFGELTVFNHFNSFGVIQPTGSLHTKVAGFSGDMTVHGKVETQHLTALKALTTNGRVRVRETASVGEDFVVGEGGVFQGVEGGELALDIGGITEVRGMLDVDTLKAAKAVDVKDKGKMRTRKTTNLTEDVTIAPESFVLLKGVKGGRRIINHGQLAILGVEADSVLNLVNMGSAYIDGEQVLPKAGEDDPENLARVATDVMAVGLPTGGIDHEFASQSSAQAKILGTVYKKSFLELYEDLLTHTTEVSVDDALQRRLKKFEGVLAIVRFVREQFMREVASGEKSLTNLFDHEFVGQNSTQAKTSGIQYKKSFVELYESLLAHTTEASVESQEGLQQYINKFKSHYTIIKREESAHIKIINREKSERIKALSGTAAASAFVIENSTVPAIRLSFLNQVTGHLTLKSGRFDFVGDTAFVNDGTLLQDQAYMQWITSSPGEFNRGTWTTNGIRLRVYGIPRER
jgi:hypothetical protein